MSYENTNEDGNGTEVGDIIGIARRQQMRSLVEQGSKAERDMKIVTSDPALMEFVEEQAKGQTCVYCKGNVMGPWGYDEYTGRANIAMEEHLKNECAPYRDLMARKAQGEQVSRTIKGLTEDIDFLCDKKKELEGKISKKFADILLAYARYGDRAPLSTSEEEHDLKWDYGKKGAIKVGVVSSIGAARLEPEQYMVSYDTKAKEDGRTRIVTPENIHRLVEDKLQELRRKWPSVMKPIDADLRRLQE